MRDPNFDAAARGEQRRAFLSQVAENSSRNAQVFCRFSTTGQGEFAGPDVISFGLAFYNQPAVSYGVAVDGTQLDSVGFPRSWGGVYSWQLNKRGFYIGAWVYMVVENGSYSLDHSFVFEGNAMKDVPVNLVQ